MFWLNCAGISLLFVALRWNSFDAPLVRDEGEYAYAAQILTRGLPPYQHSFLQKPPMVVYSYALAQAVIPKTFWAPRIFAYLSVAIATILLGLICRFEFGPGYAFLTMWLFTPMVLLPEIQQFTANTEMFLLLPLIGTVAVSVFGYHNALLRQKPSWTWFVAGVLAGMTFWFKYTAIPILGTIFAGWTIRELQSQGLLKFDLMRRAAALLLQRWFAALAGAGLASFAALAFFIFKGGLSELWECSVSFNRAYVASTQFGFASFWLYVRLLWDSWWILFLLPLALLFVRGQKVWFWVFLFFSSLLATGASVYGHYYILMMPSWAVLAVLGIHKCADWLANVSRSQVGLTRWLLAFCVLILVCYSALPWIARSREQFAIDKLRTGNPFVESPMVAQRVAELTGPSDYVFVAGSEPQILYYARRLSPTRFVIAYPLMIPTPLAQKFQREAIRDLQERPPSVIVLARSPMSWLIQESTPREFLPFLEQLLKSDYERIGGSIAEGPRTSWKEPLADDEIAASELILYKRKQPNRP
jgi:Dolichyl-phosphate-mannose-protein mannosyltransferase